MKKFVIVKGGDIWAKPIILTADSFERALEWCNLHKYDIIEEL